jgi:hypothetical protein
MLNYFYIRQAGEARKIRRPSIQIISGEIFGRNLHVSVQYETDLPVKQRFFHITEYIE